jgi:hypothetical protein
MTLDDHSLHALKNQLGIIAGLPESAGRGERR